jgi:putative glycosyltransferase (TIGR04348 family)
VLVALHAVASGGSILRFRRLHPRTPIVLVLTGTDLYRDLPRRRFRSRVLRSLKLADRIVTLNRAAVRSVPARFRSKVRCILQSAASPRVRAVRNRGAPTARFVVTVVGHLRQEKDSLRPALAVRRLPAHSRIEVVQMGAALRDSWRRRAEAEMARNGRYRWLGEISAAQVQGWMGRASLLAHPSRMEGGANAIGEAVRAGLPVVASDVSGNVGLLGRGYPGLFPVGKTVALKRLLLRAEQDPKYLERLRQAVKRLAPQFDPRREVSNWRRLIATLARGS